MESSVSREISCKSRKGYASAHRLHSFLNFVKFAVSWSLTLPPCTNHDKIWRERPTPKFTLVVNYVTEWTPQDETFEWTKYRQLLADSNILFTLFDCQNQSTRCYCYFELTSKLKTFLFQQAYNWIFKLNFVMFYSRLFLILFLCNPWNSQWTMNYECDVVTAKT